MLRQGTRLPACPGGRAESRGSDHESRLPATTLRRRAGEEVKTDLGLCHFLENMHWEQRPKLALKSPDTAAQGGKSWSTSTSPTPILLRPQAPLNATHKSNLEIFLKQLNIESLHYHCAVLWCSEIIVLFSPGESLRTKHVYHQNVRISLGSRAQSPPHCLTGHSWPCEHLSPSGTIVSLCTPDPARLFRVSCLALKGLEALQSPPHPSATSNSDGN